MSTRRNTTAATRFLGKALRSTGHRVRNGEQPSGPRVICTDKTPTYAAAIQELIDEHKLSRTVVHRQVKHLGQCDRGGGRCQVLRTIKTHESCCGGQAARSADCDCSGSGDHRALNSPITTAGMR
nr:DDE-type integrase/transposase/recombinase [Corynebacterium nuruki]